MLGYFPEYRGYIGAIEYDYEDGIYYGTIVGIKDSVIFNNDNVDKLRISFHEAVDHYIEILKQ